jgi:cytidine deaminase
VTADNQAAALWEGLLAAASGAAKLAYTPYSNYPVGAAALADDGRLVTGANVENASYGLTLCAECSLVSALVMSGGGRLAAFCCVDAKGAVIMPCGRCRQLLYEHGSADLLLLTPQGERTMATVLPQAWGADNLKTNH